VTIQFERIGDVLGLQLTRGIINTVLAVAKVAFAYEFPQQMKANTPLLVTFPSDPTFRESRFSGTGPGLVAYSKRQGVLQWESYANS
jgi:hypothetical protein